MEDEIDIDLCDDEKETPCKKTCLDLEQRVPSASTPSATSSAFVAAAPDTTLNPEPLRTVPVSPATDTSTDEDSIKTEEAPALSTAAGGLAPVKASSVDAHVSPSIDDPMDVAATDGTEPLESETQPPSIPASAPSQEAAQPAASGLEIVPFVPQAQSRIPGRTRVRVNRKKECAKSFLKCAAWTAFATSLGAAAFTAGAIYMGHIDLQPSLVELAEFVGDNLPSVLPTPQFASNAATVALGSIICSNLTATKVFDPVSRAYTSARRAFNKDRVGPAL
jgi:hypothetical protein